MPVMLDNDPVRVGDVVHDITYGTGRVTELFNENATFRVLFSAHNNRQIVYSRYGTSRVSFGRTLYWHDPIMVIPRKSEINWMKVRAVCVTVYNAMKDL
jgi:hypothetical protein